MSGGINQLLFDQVLIDKNGKATVYFEDFLTRSSRVLSNISLLKASEKAADFIAEAGFWYPCNTSNGGFILKFPASPSIGALVGILDTNGTFFANNLLLGQNGSNIMREDEPGAIDINNWTTAFVFLDSVNGWMPRGF